MKRKLLKIFIISSVLILFGSGSALAGGRNYRSSYPSAPQYKGYSSKQPEWRYQHHGPKHRYRHYYDRGPRSYYYRYYGPPVPYYYYRHDYPSHWDRYDGAYYFSGGFSEPGFGFVFGTRGNW